MNLFVTVKVFSDLCFYFSIVGLFPELFPHSVSFLWPALLCCVGIRLAVWLEGKRNPVFRYAALLLPLCSLRFAAAGIEYLILLPAVIYSAVIIHVGVFTLDYSRYRSVFVHSAGLWVGLFIVCQMIQYLQEALGFPSGFDFSAMANYGMLYMLAGVFVLRLLRLGKEHSKKNAALNGGEILTVVLLSAGMFGIVQGIRMLYSTYRDPVNRLLRWGMTLLFSIPELIISLVSGIIIEESTGYHNRLSEVMDSEGAGAAAGMIPVEPQTVTEAVEKTEAFPWWLVLLIVFGLALFLWKMLRTFLEMPAAASTAAVYGAAEPGKRRSRRERRSNREKVRRCYRDFLKIVKKRGLKLQANQSSEDILKAACDLVSPQAAEALREIYICARYNEQGEVTQEQVRRARQALRSLAREKS